MKDNFYKLLDSLSSELNANEVLLAQYYGEVSDFVRFNHAKVRQAGAVEDHSVYLTLFKNKKVVSASVNLTSNFEEDFTSGKYLLEQLKANVENAPEDPYFKFNEVAGEEISLETLADLPSTEKMTADIVELAEGLDLVGVLAKGDIYRGFASSIGHRKFVKRCNFNFDFACYLNKDKAVKSSYSGMSWKPSEIKEKLEDAKTKIEVLKKPVKSLSPGKYKTYFTPAALEEIISMMNWGGFSKKSIETKSSPLNHLVTGAKNFSDKVTFTQNTAKGFAATFDGHGFDLPTNVSLIENGKFKSALSSSRSSAEYGCEINADGEYFSALEMKEGDLPSSDVLKTLDSGLYVSNLWYTNFSDRASGKITGMTRFATFWVENGEISSPVNVMRFDDSLFEIFGSKLEAVTKEREFTLDAGTYEMRSTSSMLLPGIIVKDFELTL